MELLSEERVWIRTVSPRSSGPLKRSYTRSDFSGEAVTQDSLGLRPGGALGIQTQEEHSAESAFQSGRRNTDLVHVLSRAFSARTLLISVPRAAPHKR